VPASPASITSSNHLAWHSVEQPCVLSYQISRFGWPEGPVGNGRCFNDEGCLHVEITQPVLYDTNAKPGSTAIV
jgi:hypothetical protein